MKHRTSHCAFALPYCHIHLFCDVFLMEHINWFCCCLARFSIVIRFLPVMLYYSYTLMFSLILQHCCYNIVCHFVRSLMAFVCQEIKGLLTYLHNYIRRGKLFRATALFHLWSWKHSQQYPFTWWIFMPAFIQIPQLNAKIGEIGVDNPKILFSPPLAHA